MSRNRLFLLMAVALIVVILALGTYYALRLRASIKTEWDVLLDKLIEINRQAIDSVALDVIKPSGERRSDLLARDLEPEQMWVLLGQLDGIERLEANSRVLIEMAEYLQGSFPEAEKAAKELRLRAEELEWLVERLKMASDQGVLEFHIGTYAQNAAVAYYLMERQVQSLCIKASKPDFRLPSLTKH